MTEKNGSKICQNCGKELKADRQAPSILDRVLFKRYCSCTAGSGATSPGSSTMRKTAAQRKQQGLEQSKLTKLTAQSSIIKGGIVGGNYKIIEKIGTGGMGIVLRVAHVVIDTEYALKLLTPDQINESSWLRFQSEARSMASLTHPTFVKVYDLGLHNNQLPFYAMDLLSGITLESAIIKRGSLTLRETISIFLKVLDGLDHAHKNGIIHRDLKPSNIHLSKKDNNFDDLFDAQVKILDFGIAKVGNRAGMPAQSLTSTGEVFGSPAYMSPEQCLSGTVDARSDIYSIGCSIFESLTGFIPFDADSPAEMTIMQQSATAPFMEEIVERKFNRSIESVVHKCLEKDPANRYQSAKELAKDLMLIKEGKEVGYYRRPVATKPKSKESTKAATTEAKLWVNLLLIFLAVATISGVAAIAYLLINTEKDSRNLNDSTAESGDKSATRNTVNLEDPEADFTLRASCYHPEIPAKTGDWGVFRFPIVNSLGRVYTIEPFETFNLSGTIELPLHSSLTYRPSSHVLVKPEYFSAMVPLTIKALILGGSGPDSINEAHYSTSHGQLIISNFLQAGAKSFDITELSLSEVNKLFFGTLHNLPRLKALHLQGGTLNSLTDADDIDFLRSNLETLTIKNSQAVGPFLEELVGSSLKELSIEAESLSDRTCGAISVLNSLQTLKISVNHLSSTQLDELLSRPALTDLDIGYNAAQTAMLNEALKKHQIKHLTLRGITQVPQQLRPRLAENRDLTIVPLPVLRFTKQHFPSEE
jgi:eukaryotic-like serine/threonine-protein kinase